jgi:hypothetical protein
VTTAPAASAPLDVAVLCQEAVANTGLSDFGRDQSFRIGLEKLVASLNELQPPPPFLPHARAQLVESLGFLLHFVEDARQHPEVLAERIVAPLIIIGLPRTGTTVLYDLLGLDPATRTPRDWEFAMPWPAPEVATWTTDPRIAKMNAIFAHWLQIAPALANIQTFEATHPSECNLAFTHHFASSQFPAEWGVPSFARWLRENRPVGRYAAHKRILQQLQWKGPRGRWTLKSPEHLCTVAELIETYPDAGLIWTHRDPVKAFSSLSSMLAEFRTAFGMPPDNHGIGRYVVDTWATALEHATAVRSTNSAVDRAMVDVAHRDVIKDRIAVVRGIHERFGVPFTAEHHALLMHGADEVTHRLGKHQHSPADFGIDPADVRRRLPQYYARFGSLF